MDLNLITASGVSWFWDKYGKDITDKAIWGIKEEWKRINWPSAESKYRARLKSQHSTTRLLGRPRPIDIEGVFTDVYVLDKLTAFQQFDINRIQEENEIDRDSIEKYNKPKRYPILDIILNSANIFNNVLNRPNRDRLYILGKPGAGKTTLLKFLTIQACDGKISKTPIFVSIKEWADSGLDIVPFIEKQFEICSFPHAAPFVKLLLEDTNTLVLLDGLDEVNQESGRRRDYIIYQINEFTKRYVRPQICLTCRIASVDYSFTQFHYVEIADFNDGQVQVFVRKWFGAEKQKVQMFMKELNKQENRPIRELSRTPLLLTLLCLGFDETLSFPLRRVDLYRDAIDALLKKWDSSRGIYRDSLYKNLSPIRKEQLLARVAAQNFAIGKYFIRQDVLAGQITKHLSELPHLDLGNDLIDGQAVLKAIEAQHGLLVERAQGIYSFSHLTFQEYFTAKYVIENAPLETLNDLFEFVSDARWKEVFLTTASLLDNADHFFELFMKKKILLSGHNLLLNWANSQSTLLPNPDPSFFILTFMIAIASLFQKPEKGKSNLADDRMVDNYSYNVELMICLRKAKDVFYGTGVSEIDQMDRIIESAMPFVHIDRPTQEQYFQFAKVLDFVQSYLLSGHPFFSSTNVIGFDQVQDVVRSLNNSATQFKLNAPILSKQDVQVISQYIEFTDLFLECLKLSAVSNRKSLLYSFFSFGGI